MTFNVTVESVVLYLISGSLFIRTKISIFDYPFAIFLILLRSIIFIDIVHNCLAPAKLLIYFYENYWFKFVFLFNNNRSIFSIILYLLVWIYVLFIKINVLLAFRKFMKSNKKITIINNIVFGIFDIIVNFKHKHILGYRYLIYNDKYDCSVCHYTVPEIEIGGYCQNK